MTGGFNYNSKVVMSNYGEKQICTGNVKES
jgi:hypothetical protein